MYKRQPLWSLLRFPVASRFDCPLSTKFTCPDLRAGSSSPLIICNCLIPERYVFTVPAVTFLTRRSQSTKISTLLFVSGKSKGISKSLLHLSSIFSAVRYELHVFFVIAKLPIFANDFRVISGRDMVSNNDFVQPPVAPYLVLPRTALGPVVPV